MKRFLLFQLMIVLAISLIFVSDGASKEKPKASGPTGQAQPQFVLKAQSFLPATCSVHQDFLHAIMMIEKYSDHRIKINAHAGGEIVSPEDVTSAVSKGVLDAGCIPMGYFSGKSPALAIYCSHWFGLTSTERIGWLYDGGGLKIQRQLINKFYDVELFPYMQFDKVYLHSTKRIKNLDEFRKLRMRMTGLDGDLVKEVGGIDTIMVSGAEIVPSLQKGVIDATNYADMNFVKSMHLLKTLKYHYYFRGGFVTAMSFLVNPDVWDKFPDDLKEAFKTAMYDSLLWHQQYSITTNMKSMREAEEKYGGEVLFFPEDVEAALKAAKKRLYAKMVKKDPDFALVVNSMDAYHKEWGKYAALADKTHNNPLKH